MKKLLTLLAATFFININAQVCFNHVDSFYVASGMGASSICNADFNGDSKLDLATANVNGNISVMLGTGTGTFGAATTFSVNSGGGGCSLTAADLNGDGKVDLATANFINQNVSVLIGDGAGNFGAATSYTLGNQPQQIISADFNNDGKMDLATANPFCNYVTTLINAGAGNFTWDTVFVHYNNGPYSLTAADFNNDGKLDIATANFGNGFGSSGISVVLGNGAGGFGAPTDFFTNTAVYAITSADFNNDGKMDLVMANYFANSISVLLGNGTGGFAQTDITTNNIGCYNPNGIITADFTGDGKMDIATMSKIIVAIFVGDGAGSFSNPIPFSIDWNEKNFTSGDFDGNGKPDLAFADSLDNRVLVLSNALMPTLSIGATSTTVCQGSNIILTASGSSSGYVWNTSATTNTISVLPTTSTTYSVTDGLACSNTATITINVGTAATPNICMVTTDAASSYNYNIVYWDKTQYTNVDSFIVYRFSTTVSNYLRIGAVSKNALSEFTDTAFSIGGPNGGNPQYTSWKYKLAIRDTCGNISAMSPYHETMFVQENNANFSWNAYTVETGQTNPITGYSFLRDDNNTGAWHILVNTSGISSTDPNYSSFPNGNWRVDATGFNCTPTLRLAGGNNNASTYVNSHSNTTKPVAAGISQVKTTSNQLNIYPNPSNGYFVIETNSLINQTMQVYNANGKLLLSQSINNTAVIDGSKLSEGVYYISIISADGVTNKKLVIVK